MNMYSKLTVLLVFFLLVANGRGELENGVSDETTVVNYIESTSTTKSDDSVSVKDKDTTAKEHTDVAYFLDSYKENKCVNHRYMSERIYLKC